VGRRGEVDLLSQDANDPLAPARGLGLDGLLGLLEQLEGAEEAAVVRSALAAGVPPAMVLDELQREVERRLMRTQQFYDEWT
jgi:hypothetical protein